MMRLGSLVFDKDIDLEAALVACVTDRPADVTVPPALRLYIRTRADVLNAPGRDDFIDLVRTTPALRD